MTPVREGRIWEVRVLAVVTVTLVVFGIAAVYGASSIFAVENGGRGPEFALRQLVGASMGGVLLLLGRRLDYRIYCRNAWPILLAVCTMLLIPLLPFAHGIAPELNGARRWVRIGFVTLQPSELTKLAVVIWCAMLATKKGDRIREFKLGVLPFLTVLAPVALMILLEPDLSTTVLVLMVAGTVLFVAGARIGHFMLIGLVALPVLWHEITQVHYRLQRWLSFLSPGSDQLDTSWQINQSLTGIGSGRLFGVGFGEGLQKLGYLPHAYSDFIFSTIGEEWGFVGSTVILLLFTAFLVLGFRIARTAPDRFGTLLAAGITAMITITAVLHIAVTLGVIPTTGLPLPFMSYGRTNLVVSLFATGVLMNIGSQRESETVP